MSQIRHFLDISDYDSATLGDLIRNSAVVKKARKNSPCGVIDAGAPLQGRVLAVIFEKPSTRTRVSFDVAMRQLGGETLILSASEMQLGRGESVADTAKVLSRFVDAIVIRTSGHDKLGELAANASVPVINGLTDFSHPCQVMADLLTLQEHRGDLSEQIVTWVGDSNNVTHSWIHAAARFGFELRIASPSQLQPNDEIMTWAKANNANVVVSDDPFAMTKGANCVVADTWVSMHDEDGAARHNLLQSFQVNKALMAMAAPDAIFMHCLPAHRGEEVTAEIIDGPQSVVFDEAENRLHVQKGILTFCLSTN